MKKIIGLIKPFDLHQNFYVYDSEVEEGAMVREQCSMQEVSNEVLKLSEAYETFQVDLTGPRLYTEKIKKDIEKAEMTKYSQNKLEINLI